MDRRLFQVPLTRDIQNLYQRLEENPLILQTVALTSTGSPLLIASASWHVDFVKEFKRLTPYLAKEVNEEGFSPMHMASANGHVEIVMVLTRNYVICKDQRKRPIFRCATIKGRVDVVSEMLSACPDCIKDVTHQRETALHLAIKNNQFGAIGVLMDWIRDTKNEGILNMKDKQGNTVLHLATWKKQHQVIELLLGHGATAVGLLERPKPEWSHYP